jgi:3-phenylpropionate/trans-cinnamate dioxygenase ferredoxin reductase component
MGSEPVFVIVGANLAGGAAVKKLRDEGFAGGIVMIGEEPHPPYERPPLSKDYLRGETALSDALLLPPAWYDENDVELRLGVRAERIDPAGRTVELAGGERIPYDKVLIATGGRNREFPIPGHDLRGVLQLRTVEDSDRIREEAGRAGRVAVVGAGFIGLEVAASLRAGGPEVEIVEVGDVPLAAVLGPELGRVYEGIHRDHGVRFHFNERVERFEGGGDGRVGALVTDRGTRVECDLAVVGVGIRPNVEIAEAAGIQVDNGILVDEAGRTSAEDVFAAGDVANHRHPVFGQRIRVEHWDNALKMGAAVARTMLGGSEPFDDTHWFWSEQFEHELQYVGFAPRWDRLVVRGSLEARSFLAFYLQDGVVKAVAGLGHGRNVRRAAGLVRLQRPVDPERLLDEDQDLKALTRELSETPAR